MNEEKYLVCISGPSGAGKGTVVKALLEKHPEITVSVSATTRQPRPGEVDHVHYHFITKEAFEDNIQNQRMLEYNKYCGNYYYRIQDPIVEKAETDDAVEKSILNHQVMILEIDVNGVENVKKVYPGALTVFILPPSMEELEHRLSGRGTETQQVISQRLARAKEEMALADAYDVQIVNRDVDSCVDELYSIIQERLK